jgi:hypothetical protein
MGFLFQSLLRMAKGMGFSPTFNMSHDEAKEWLDTGIEVMRMIRDGDSNSNDDRARRVYSDLFSDPT